MGGSADVRLHPDTTVRLFTEQEATALVPGLEEVFLRLDPKLARMRELRELIEDSEAYYGEGLEGAPGTDRDAYARHLQEEADVDRSIREEVNGVLALGCEVKDLHRGLVDFPARIGTEIAYLCWKRGEARIGWWHTLSGGFAGRKALAPQTER